MTAGDVLEFQVLTTKPDSAKALLLLKKVASLVKPIMVKHGWTLPKLCEFFPKNPNLLGINCNRGQKICLRLRPHDDPTRFYDIEEMIIGTMLHELTHNVRGPHDDIFFKQLDELQDEYDLLRASGYEGEGFLGKGSRVGLGVSHDAGISIAEARKKALKKLEEREKITRLLGKGGKLGGKAPELKGRRLADVIADAAERRQKANGSCGGHDDLAPEISFEIEKAARESKSFFIDLTGEDDEDVLTGASDVKASGSGNGRVELEDRKEIGGNSNLVKGKEKGNQKRVEIVSDDSDSDIEIISVPSKRPQPPSTSTSTSTQSSSLAKRHPSAKKSKEWNCLRCTFTNSDSAALACEVCNNRRPGLSTLPPEPLPSTSLGWICEDCFTSTDHNFWTCFNCGKVKNSSAPY